MPNVDAALNLGEIAEERKNADEAVRQYAVAFLLAGQDLLIKTAGVEKNCGSGMGNLFGRNAHPTQGLGDVLLTSVPVSQSVGQSRQSGSSCPQ